MNREKHHLWVIEAMHLNYKKWCPYPYGCTKHTRREAREYKKYLEIISSEFGWRFRIVKYEAGETYE